MREPYAIVLFDGACGFCNRSVKWLIERDPRGRMRFAPLKSPLGQRLLAEHHLPLDYDKSLVLIDRGRAFLSSTGMYRICGLLRWPWKACLIGLLIPRFIRDPAYRWVARRRHGLLRGGESCQLPTAQEVARFVDDVIPNGTPEGSSSPGASIR